MRTEEKNVTYVHIIHGKTDLNALKSNRMSFLFLFVDSFRKITTSRQRKEK